MKTQTLPSSNPVAVIDMADWGASMSDQELRLALAGGRHNDAVRACMQLMRRHQASCDTAARDPGNIVAGLGAYNSGAAQGLCDVMHAIESYVAPPPAEDGQEESALED